MEIQDDEIEVKPNIKFKIDFIVWKSSSWIDRRIKNEWFKIDFIVWKSIGYSVAVVGVIWFKIDFIVWKLL